MNIKTRMIGVDLDGTLLKQTKNWHRIQKKY